MSRSALILYGSETGNAQDSAEEAGRLTERFRFETRVIDLDSVQLRDIAKYSVVVFVVSTTGQGEFPQNARSFWKALLSSVLKPGILRKLRFASFGLGDSSYAQYNVAHRMLYGRLVQLGAQAFCERGEGNEQHPEGHSAGLRAWLAALRQSIIETFPLHDGLKPIADDVFIEPKWKLIESTSSSATGGLPAESKQAKPDVPHPDLLPVAGAYTADIACNTRLTPTTHFQDVRLLDLCINDRVDYGPGAVAVIYPKNFPEDVQSFIDLMSWEDVADLPLQLTATQLYSGSSPSPLRNLNLDRTRLTIRWLLENVLDIMTIPRRSFFAALVHFATDENEEGAYQKERLQELANPDLIDELWDYTTRPKRTILEVMMDFTTIKIPWTYALTILPIMRGRQFSIASGGALATDENGRTRIQLLIAIVDPPSLIIKWRRRYGVCTRYVTALREGQQLSVGVQQGYLDVKPTELSIPIMMVGPGTGLAPMRAMIHQRLAWARESNQAEPFVPFVRDALFFGCRSESADCFFQGEWQQMVAEGRLDVFTAFSRDDDKPKQYVQDQIRAQGTRVKEILLEKGGKIYVCGSSGNMPKGVRQSILDVLASNANDMDQESAEAYLETMEKNGRYKQETW